MRAPGFSALFLVFVLELTPRPGYSQGASGFKHCRNCKELYKEEDVKEKLYQLLVQRANHTECSTNIIEFKLPKGSICVDKHEAWVDWVIKCINKGRTPCLEESKNQQDFSQGSNEKPRTTTQEFPTSTAKTAPPLRLSTQTWTGGTLKPSKTSTELIQKILEATIGLTTTGPDSDQNKDLLYGNGPTSEKDDVKRKMSQMTIAIISLLLIVLVMTAVGVYVWCQKGSLPHCKKHCVEETVRYQKAPSEASIPIGP